MERRDTLGTWKDGRLADIGRHATLENALREAAVECANADGSAENVARLRDLAQGWAKLLRDPA